MLNETILNFEKENEWT